MDIHTHPHLRPPRLLLPDLLVTVSCHAIPVVVPRIDDMDNDRPHNRVAILPCSAIIPHLRRTDRRSSWYSIHFEDVSIEFLLEVPVFRGARCARSSIALGIGGPLSCLWPVSEVPDLGCI